MADLSYAPYELVRGADGNPEVLGQGAMGLTFRARDPQLDRTVALKVIRPDCCSDPHLRQRFLAEARAAAQISHPNVATVHHLHGDGEILFYAMEFVHGETLAAHVASRGPMAAPAALEVIRQAAEGLAAAHECGLLHRDIKPANIMLVDADHAQGVVPKGSRLVKVIDFGLAKSLTGRSGITDGSLVGTPPYMSPEQIAPEGRSPDCRSDIYSLGVTLWFLLTGKVPFQGTQFQVFSQHLQRPPPQEQLRAAQVPPPVIDFVLRLMAKDREDRPAGYAELLAELRPFLQDGNESTVNLEHGATDTSDATVALPAPARGESVAIHLRWAVLVTVTLVVAGAAGLLAWPRSAPAEITTAPVRSWPLRAESRQVVRLLDDVSSTRDDCRLAEEISARQLRLAPADPEAVIIHARVQGAFLLRQFDQGEERYRQAKTMGERAVQLAPDEPEALYALSVALTGKQLVAARCEALIRRACKLDPGNSRFWRQLLRCQSALKGVTLGFELIERFPDDPILRYEVALAIRNAGDWHGFEEQIDRLLKTALPRAFTWKAQLLSSRGDFDGALKWLLQIPERARTEERPVFVAVQLALLGRRFAGDNWLRSFGDTWFHDQAQYAGPTDLLWAEVLSQQGKGHLARERWAAALELIQRQGTPRRAARAAEVWCLLGLERKDEARAQARIWVESFRAGRGLTPATVWWFHPIPALLLLGESDAALSLLRREARSAASRELLRRYLSVDARLAAFRDDERISALLAPRLPAAADQSNSD